MKYKTYVTFYKDEKGRNCVEWHNVPKDFPREGQREQIDYCFEHLPHIYTQLTAFLLSTSGIQKQIIAEEQARKW